MNAKMMASIWKNARIVKTSKDYYFKLFENYKFGETFYLDDEPEILGTYSLEEYSIHDLMVLLFTKLSNITEFYIGAAHYYKVTEYHLEFFNELETDTSTDYYTAPIIAEDIAYYNLYERSDF